jgi:integrase
MYRIKGLNGPKVQKGPKEMFLLPEQVKTILRTIETSGEPEAIVGRDHAIVYLGFHLGLRVSEVGLLTRKAFRSLEDQEIAYIPTLKKAKRIPVACECGRRFRVSVMRIETVYPCPKCGAEIEIEGNSEDKVKHGVPELEIPVPEPKVREYIMKYLGGLPDGQDHLFVGRPHTATTPKVPLLGNGAERIFGSWVVESGLSPVYSFHALRHGRGVQLYDATKDLKFVQTCLRHESMRTSEIYVHLSPENIEKFSGELNRRAI